MNKETPRTLCLGVTRSCRGQAWNWRCADEDLITEVSQRGGVDDLTARLLAGRGVDPEQVQTFLDPRIRDFLPNPSTLQDMDIAAREIVSAVMAKKKITIFADYDVDGGTSAAQIIRWARHFGHDIGLYVPDRVAEGYGPTPEAFTKLKDAGNDLVITVDCGAAAHSALEAAAAIDLPVVVIDHHLMDGNMPPALALVNPNRADDSSGLGHLAAAGVTFVLLVALSREARKQGMGEGPNLLGLLDLAALGTVCDVVPLKGLNRAIVAQGFKALSVSKHAGIVALADVAGAGAPFTTYHGGFVFGPRINAGGRIGRADMGAEMLSTENMQLAYSHAAELDRVNQERKALQDTMLQEALTKALALPDDAPLALVAMEGWHPGVIGIVAGRLKDRFDKPAIVIGVNEDGIGKGSGRSMTGVNLGGAITAARDAGLLLSGGGHAMAGGLTVEADKIGALTEFLEAHLREDVAAARAALALKIDAQLMPSAATPQLIETQKRVGPYGAGHPQPNYVFANMRIAYAERVRGGHVRCSFEDSGGARVNGICFRADETGLSEILLSPNSARVHVAGRLKENIWKGRVKIDLNVEDIALAG
ncbi:MAG: single-stranded-DNA-specific exonuclease RecJ [Maricaulaceae bacterium]